MKRIGGTLAVLLTVLIMKEDLTVTFVARSVPRYSPYMTKKKITIKKKDTTKVVVGKKAPKRPYTRYIGIRKERNNENLYEIQICTGNRHRSMEKR